MLGMRTVLSGEAWVHYAQIYVSSDYEGWPGLDESFGGQRNGLCGAATPGAMHMITGLHTGEVGFTVEVHDKAPPVDLEWEEIVEVPFCPNGPASLSTWGGEDSWDLGLELTDYRVRYCASGMDEGHTADTRPENHPVIDRYLLQFWPDSPRPDEIVKQTSEHAAYWHDYAQSQPPPPTPDERAEAKRLADLEKQREAEEARHRAEEARLLSQWDGRLPSARLVELGRTASNVADYDRPFVDALGESTAETQREVLKWTIRRAYAEASLTDIDWIAPALAAVDNDQPLPPPFDDNTEVWNRLLGDPQVPRTLVTTLDGRHDNALQQAMALPAIFGAHEEDPLAGALSAVRTAIVTYGRGNHPRLFAELRQAFPDLR
jgi:hypothetical protein